MGILSSCSDFRKAAGKEVVIPDEFSVAVTPSLLIPPGYEIDPQVFKNNDLDKTNDNFNLNEEIDIKDNKDYCISKIKCWPVKIFNVKVYEIYYLSINNSINCIANCPTRNKNKSKG